jgi:hypothetical protein
MRFLRTLLLSLAACAVVYLLAAVCLDPGREFLQRHRQPLPDNQGEICRLQKLKLVAQFAAAGHVDALILGSSRVMKVPPAAFATRGRVFNFGVPNAKMHDILACYRHVKALGGRPRYLLVGLDVAAFDPLDCGPTADLKAIPALYSHVARSLTPGERLEHARQIYSLTYAGKMLREVPALRRNLDVPLPVPLSSEAYYLDPDGLIQYRDKEQALAAGTYDWQAFYEERMAIYRDVFATMPGLAPSAQACLELLLSEAAADGARVHLWVTAFHPDAETELTRTTAYPRRVAELRQYLARLALRDRVRVSDLLDPARYGDPRRNWYDAVHLSPAGAARLADLLREDARGF